MDLITYAMAKKSVISPDLIDSIIPYIGENGNWYVRGEDTGISALPANVIADGILKADTVNQKVVVIKDNEEIIVGEFTDAIGSDDILKLFN